MNDAKYFIISFEQDDKIMLNQNGYFRGVDGEALVSYEKNKKF